MQTLVILHYIAFFTLVLGFFVLSQNHAKLPNIFFSLICFGMFLWISGLILLQTPGTFYWPDKMTLFGGLAVVTCLYCFSLFFPMPLKISVSFFAQPGRNFWLRLAPATLVLVLLPFNIFIKKVIFQNGSFSPVNGRLYPLLSLIELGYIIAALRNLRIQFANSIGYRRQQLNYFFVGLVSFLIFSGIFDLLLPLFGISNFKFFGALAAILFLVFSVAAIISYSLMDLRLLFGGFVVNIMSAAVLAAAALRWSQAIEKDIDPSNTRVVLFVFYALLAYFIVRAIFSLLVRAVLLKNYYRSMDYFSQLNLKLNYIQDTKEIIAASNYHLLRALGISWIYFYDSGSGKIIYDPSDSKSPAPKFSTEQIYSQELNEYAALSREPEFFGSPRFAEFIAARQQPLALLPIWDGQNFCGYFVLGPQTGVNGLSAEQIRRTKTVWAHIHTSYCRALLQKNLEQKVSDQVREITLAYRLLKEETEKRMDFLRNASHQLRTPITAMTSSLQLLMESAAAGEAKQLAEIAYKKSKDLSGIVRGMLILAKVEQSLPSEFSGEVQLDAVLRDVVAMLRPAAETKNISIEFSPAESAGPRVAGNASYLAQAFSNLIENAINYTSQGSVTVSYILEPDFAIVSIKDTGMGISPEQRDLIFNRHMRSSSSKGNGLGLYIVKAIANAHPKSHIWFESEPGKGTIFYFRLALSSAAQQQT